MPDITLWPVGFLQGARDLRESFVSFVEVRPVVLQVVHGAVLVLEQRGGWLFVLVPIRGVPVYFSLYLGLMEPGVMLA